MVPPRSPRLGSGIPGAQAENLVLLCFLLLPDFVILYLDVRFGQTLCPLPLVSPWRSLVPLDL